MMPEALDAMEVSFVEEFSKHYSLLRGTAAEYLQKVQDVLWSDPDEKLRLFGITKDDSKARVKDTKSAKASALRRARDMLERRQLYEKAPTEFAARALLEWSCSEDEALKACQPFKRMEDGFREMHDLVGMRIFLRSPSALRELLAYLDQHFDCKGGHRKDKALSKALRTTTRSANELKKIIDEPEDPSSTAMLSGYQSFHVIFKLKKEHLDNESLKNLDSYIQVELQIGSVFMYAWAELEHELKYNREDQKGDLTEEDENIMAMMNVFAKVADAALRQLDSAECRRESERALQEDVPFKHSHELATWLQKIWEMEHKMNTQPWTQGWCLLPQVAHILQCTGITTFRALKDLALPFMKEGYPEGRERRFPLLILDFLNKKAPPTPSVPFSGSEVGEHARWQALMLVDGINLAIYIESGSTFLGILQKRLAKEDFATKDIPSIADLLEILHPVQPTSTADRALRVGKFCERLLQPLRERRNYWHESP